MMKNIILMVVLVLISLGYYSCRDSYGIDPNVREEPKNLVGGSDTAKSIEILAKNVAFFCVDYYTGELGIGWGINYKVLELELSLDTSQTSPLLNFNKVNFKSSMSDVSVALNYSGKKMRVISFFAEIKGLKIDSKTNYTVDGSEGSGNFCSVVVQDIASKQTTIVTSQTNPATLVISGHDKEEGKINASLFMNLESMPDTSIAGFSVQFGIFYK